MIGCGGLIHPLKRRWIVKRKKKRIVHEVVIAKTVATPIWREDAILFAIFLFPSILLFCSMLYIMQVFILEKL